MSYRSHYESWLTSPALSAEELSSLRAISHNDAEIKDRFFAPLQFGTAGLRGIMGLGLNRMNIHVIRHATQAFAEVILGEGEAAQKKGIAICFDCRNSSQDFAREAACVMAANGIPVFLFAQMRPTPELSFAVREYGCIAGINVTASHNPKEYNGYKVYWEDGAQLPPQKASAIATRMSELDVFTSVKTTDYEAALADGMIRLLTQDTDDKFLGHVMTLVNDYDVVARVAPRFRMVYTPFHGVGREQIPYVLKKLGVQHLFCVPEQMIPDGNFPTVISPNPENPESFALAIALAKQEKADFILGSDPDADRVGILARDKTGEYKLISGNQTGVLLLEYLIGARKRAGTLPAQPVALKTIVTTELARQVAQKNGVACYDTFTGFKFMAEKKNALEAAGEGTVFFSYEESFGYMLSDCTRDKDAVSAALLLTEMTAYYFDRGMTLFDALEEIFETYGYYEERTLNLVMPGLSGMEAMKNLMAGLRQNPPKRIAGIAVITQRDYQTGVLHDWQHDRSGETELIGSNVLKYHLEDGTDLVIRPSGTEPKIKVYILARAAEDRQDCHRRVEQYAAWANETLK